MQQHQPRTRANIRRGSLAVGLSLAVLPLTPAPAMAGGDHNANVVTKAKAQVHGQAGKMKTDVRFDLSDRWAQRVRATAATTSEVDCTDCHGSAIVFQVVVGNQIEVSQSAVATSLCGGCSSLALNYTFAVQSAEAVSFTSDQMRAFAHIESQLRDLDRSNLHANGLASRAADLAAQVRTVLDGAMESGSNRGKGKVSTRHSMSKRG